MKPVYQEDISKWALLLATQIEKDLGIPFDSLDGGDKLFDAILEALNNAFDNPNYRNYN